MCIASANAPFAGMVHGIQRYLELGIESQKLILGVPWYGYRYPCLPAMTDVHSQFCPIPQVAFRGVNCSDAVGSEIPYGRILQRYATTAASCRSHMKRDEFMDAVYFNSQEEADHGNETRIYQYWFDDAAALTHKFAWAKSMQLGGIGPFQTSLVPCGVPLTHFSPRATAHCRYHSRNPTVLRDSFGKLSGSKSSNV